MLPSGPGGAYSDQSKYLRERPENRSAVQPNGFVKNPTRTNVIDDGLSMMTSALTRNGMSPRILTLRQAKCGSKSSVTMALTTSKEDWCRLSI